MRSESGTEETADCGFRFRLLSEPFEKIVRGNGWTTDAEIAQAVYLSERQVRRIRSGKTPPGLAFVAGFMHAAPEADPRQIFEIVSAAQPHQNEE